ncbi:xyloglucan endotransglucosylase/hydrolase protein 20-like [Telopea speciosissima]|uniref:xyloglucan endotransglucosylase/hydrolase protein 20-like n=1 Tax=Telopea speciosissima TaxID=54955 RepID=UPI001CC54D3D|nr:xyloglucan endotransglucosylase/hydrolase protein 20-like [Telopea speciosissima]
MSSADLGSEVEYLFGEQRMKLSEDGQEIELSLDQYSGSGFQSKRAFIYGKFDILMKLPPGNSAGTVTTFYLNSTRGEWHDELDLEFLGHVDGSKYILQTNVFTRGVGNREQRIRLWFDPTIEFHKYSILWNPQQIIFYVDDIPIDFFKSGREGIPYPNQQPMTLYATIWDGSSWATEYGKIKLNMSYAPFIVSYRDYEVDGCVWTGHGNNTLCSNHNNAFWKTHTITMFEKEMLAHIHRNYIFYDYCTSDPSKFNPTECAAGLLQ